MPKILLLSCNNGGGHNSVAQALCDLFSANGYECVIKDALSYVSETWSRTLSGFHVAMYRWVPSLNRLYYQLIENYRQLLYPDHMVRRSLQPGLSRLAEDLQGADYDAVICTHILAGTMVSDVCRRYHLHLPFGMVETDYTVTPGAEACTADWYFVPSSQQRDSLVALGVEPDRIVVTGIPINNSMKQHLNREEARKLTGFSPESQVILIMFGSMGCGPIGQLTREFSRQTGSGTELAVVCGSNEPLYTHLNHIFSGQSRIHLYRHVSDIGTLMAAADVLVTKPGGISTTEAAAIGLPMALLDIVGGCEARNLQFLTGCGCAISADTPAALTEQVLDFQSDPVRPEQMKQALSVLSDLNRPDLILQAVSQKIR